jgi:hypothetical protein
MTYLFPIYVFPGFQVYRDRFDNDLYLTICLIADSRSGKILSFSTSFEHPNVDLYQRAVIVLRNSLLTCATARNAPQLFTATLRERIDYKRYRRGDDRGHLSPVVKGIGRRRLNLIDERKFGMRFLQYFYDWHPLDRAQMSSHYRVRLPVLMSILERAIEKMNADTAALQ